MSRRPSPDPASPIAAGDDIRTLAGLRDGHDPAAWSRIRAAQLAAGRRLAPALFVAHAATAAATVAIVGPTAPAHLAPVWGMLVVLVALAVTVRRWRSHHRPGGDAGIGALRGTMVEGLALAAVWIVAPLWLARDVAPVTLLSFGAVAAMLMTGAAIAMAPLLLATLLFLFGLSAATALRFALDGAPVPAVCQIVFALLLAILCVGRARALVAIRAAQIALDERDETVSLLLRESADQGADWLWETDAARRIVRASPRFAVACGRDVAAIEGQPLVAILAGPTWEGGRFAAGLHLLAERLKARDSFRDLRLPVYRTDGEERWWALSAGPRFDDSGNFIGFRGVGSDVTEQRASADRIARLARYDALTGLPNRLMVNETLAQAMAEADGWGGRCAFMMIDLDRFKAVNDTLGHPIGDRLLSRVAERLGQLMGPEAMCGRLGGDEFAVVVRGLADGSGLEALAQRIIDTLSRPYEIDQHVLHVGASIGLAVAPRDGRTAEMLIRSADLALYRAKDRGRGVYSAYEPSLHARAEERRVLELALRQALERGEMHLAYQPVVEARSGTLTGFEALLRWDHPELGAVPPSRFLPIAEDMRLIAPIGEWVVRTACREAAGWPDGLRVAVNIAPGQLATADLVGTVTSALAQSGLTPDRLELEVAESVFLHEGRGAARTLERLIELGVRLSLDDFGTGQSSLGHLGRLRFSSVKIDRSFVQAAAAGARAATAIIRAVVALTDSLDMITVAEGVETESEHGMVQALGCRQAQGHYFSRPLPVEEARALARHWRAAA